MKIVETFPFKMNAGAEMFSEESPGLVAEASVKETATSMEVLRRA
ncbi:MAG: hypothetical protein ABI623_06135 [bacterium]